MKIQCVIVDDEAPARDELRYLLSGYEDIEVIGEASSAGKAVALIREMGPDLVFLDIEMPGGSGFDVLEDIAGLPKVPLVVFATAFDQYAVKAFEASASDYILKPLSSQRLAAALEKVRRVLRAPPGESLEARLKTLLDHVSVPAAPEIQKISVEKNGRMRLLAPDDIVYCSYEENRILVHTFDEALPIYGISTMDRLEEHLTGSTFFRVHRSVLVNLDCIREFSPWFHGKYSLIMNDSRKSELSVSRSRVKEFKHRLGL